MSLRHFHLFFIAVATLFCLFFAGWALLDQRRSGASADIGYFAFGIIAAGGLASYGLRANRVYREAELKK